MTRRISACFLTEASRAVTTIPVVKLIVVIRMEAEHVDDKSPEQMGDGDHRIGRSSGSAS
jgi:hypothetical protein